MAFEYRLPDVGEGVAEGEIVEWHVSPGDTVTEDQVLAEVETDKAVVDLPSPVDGTILELHAEAGDIVDVGSVVVTLEVEGEVDEADVVDGEEAVAESGGEAGTAESAPAAPEDGESAETAAASVEGRVFAPPHVRRLARELDVAIASIQGSGPSGRITEGDVRKAAMDDSDEATAGEAAGTAEAEPAAREEAVTTAAAAGEEPSGGETAPETATAAPAAAVESADRDRTLAAPATRQLARELDVDIDAVPTEKTRDGEAFVEPEDVKAFAEAGAATAAVPTAEAGPEPGAAPGAEPGGPAEGERVTTEPYRGVRRTIGNKMAESAYTAPHATHHDTATVSELVDARAQLKERAADRDVNLTYMPFIMKAIVAGLREHPVMNTELDEEAEEIRYKHYYNIGVAVATDAGLMVPVVEDVDKKGLVELAAEVSDLVERARNRKLTPEEMRGSTFSITNFGAIGGEYATPIINHPETAILGLGTIEQRPVVEDGEVVARHTLPLSLSIDHRVIDGADGARFCNTVIEYLENPTLLLLE